MKAMKNKIDIVIEKTNTGFSAYSEDHAIFTTARTIPELIGNTVEAANLYFEEKDLPVTQENINFIIDFKTVFSIL